MARLPVCPSVRQSAVQCTGAAISRQLEPHCAETMRTRALADVGSCQSQHSGCDEALSSPLHSNPLDPTRLSVASCSDVCSPQQRMRTAINCGSSEITRSVSAMRSPHPRCRLAPCPTAFHSLPVDEAAKSGFAAASNDASCGYLKFKIANDTFVLQGKGKAANTVEGNWEEVR